MPPTSRSSRVLPTLSLLLSITPTVLMLILVALSARGNWGFLILGGITYLVSELVCGISVAHFVYRERKKGYGKHQQKKNNAGRIKRQRYFRFPIECLRW